MIDWLANHPPTLYHWLVLSTLLFSIGLFGVLTRRNAIAILMAVEILLNSASINFIVFNRYIMPRAVDGQVMSLFIMATAAAEVVIAMAIFVSLYRDRKTIDVKRMNQIRDEQEPADAAR
jgi:NADH-quinone oxidoreductase subunit K